MALIKVEGEASRRVRAEEGTVRLTFRISGMSRAEVFSAASETHKALVAAAQQHVDGGAAARVDADSVTVWKSSKPEERGTEGDAAVEVATEFRAGGTVRVVFLDAATLGSFVSEAAALSDVDVEGVTWQVTDETRRQVEREVRVAAGQDAAARAAAYAEALGLGVPTLEELVEERSDFAFGGPRRRPIRRTPRGMQNLSASTLDSDDTADDGPTESFALRPSEVTVSAAVSATFSAN